MAKKTILIVEDDEDIQQLVSYNLIKSGFGVECAESGEQALELVRERRTDLIIIDIMLPGMDGLEVCRTLRSDSRLAKTPIIMLTAKGEERDVITGLDLGADDYVTKPFSPKILISRIKSVLRRRAESASALAEQGNEVITIHDLRIDPGRHEVTLAGRRINLTPTEFAILRLLAKRAGWVFTRQQIIDAVRGYDYLITPRAMDVQVFSLRKKLGDTGRKIETVRGVGYRLED
ncbi:MAG: response regulator transcription factor [Desulfobacterales bacterium]|nr:response regulator transcription factor [Desulfobacterales bacterium]